MSIAITPGIPATAAGTINYDPRKESYSYIKPAGKLADALAKAQAEFKTVNKTKTAKINATFSYKYADLSDVLNMVVPALAKQGIAFSQPIRREGDKMYVVTRIQLGDEFLEDAGLPVPTQVRPQEMGTYITYARRYGVSTFLGIAADEDTDAQETRENKSSTSGQVDQSLVNGPVRKAGRPTASKQEVAKTVAPVVPTAPSTPPIATDSDIPANIGSRPTMEEMAEIKKQLNSFDMTKDALKEFVLKHSGRSEARELTKQEWDEVIKALQEKK